MKSIDTPLSCPCTQPTLDAHMNCPRVSFLLRGLGLLALTKCSTSWSSRSSLARKCRTGTSTGGRPRNCTRQSWESKSMLKTRPTSPPRSFDIWKNSKGTSRGMDFNNQKTCTTRSEYALHGFLRHGSCTYGSWTLFSQSFQVNFQAAQEPNKAFN